MIVSKILEQGNDWNVKWDMLNHNTGNSGPFFCKAFYSVKKSYPRLKLFIII